MNSIESHYPFIYSKESLKELSEKDFVAVIPKEITEPELLLLVLYEKLKFPSYFGFNWNALDECLRDFHWNDKYRIVIVHEELPRLQDKDLKIYLEVLRDCANDWKPQEEHKLVIYFPFHSYATIQSMLNTSS